MFSCGNRGSVKFEEMLAEEMARFKKQARWVLDVDSSSQTSQEALLEAGVIDLKSATNHGKNCSPFVKENN